VIVDEHPATEARRGPGIVDDHVVQAHLGTVFGDEAELHHFAPDQLSPGELGDRFTNLSGLALFPSLAVSKGELGNAGPLALAVEEHPISSIRDHDLGAFLNDLEPTLAHDPQHVFQVSSEDQHAPE
jgi:hypothetical protein